MKNEVLWLIRLGLDQKMFTRDQALAMLRMAGRDADLMDFAQKLIDEGIVADVGRLETIAGDAMARAEAGPPAVNPLLEEKPAAEPARPAGGASRVSAAANGLPVFPFDAIASLNDAALADAMRQLLLDAGTHGASDLHLSAGSTPFIRRNRALSSITGHILTEEEALRLNTALLAEHQKKSTLNGRTTTSPWPSTPQYSVGSVVNLLPS